MQRKILDPVNKLLDLKKRGQLVRALTSPIRKLPPELLSKIFELVVHTNVILGRPGAQRLGAVSLSGVCSNWRTVILGTPWIWTSLSLYIDTIRLTDVAYRRATEYLEAALQRAGPIPLGVTIEFHQFYPSDGYQFVSLMSALMNHLPGWRSVTFRQLSGSRREFSSLDCSGLIPHLQSVEILEFDEPDCIEYNPVSNIVLEDHPLFPLRKLDHDFSELRVLLLPRRYRPLSTIPLSHRPRIFHSRLTRLRICAGLDFRDTLESLRSCSTSLETLSFHVFPCIDRGAILNGQQHQQLLSFVPIQFDRLHELIIEVTEENYATSIHPLSTVQKVLKCIVCRSLESLNLRSRMGYNSYKHIRGGPEKVSADLAWFRLFIERSGLSTKLQKFGLGGFGMNALSVIEILQILPHIRELKIIELYEKEQEDNDRLKIITSQFCRMFRAPQDEGVDAEITEELCSAFLPRLRLMRIFVFRELGKVFEEMDANRKRRTEVYRLDGQTGVWD